MGRKRFKSSKPKTFCFEFPLDLVGQVLGRLPVKTLVKFRCVCKEWRSLIDSSDFASLHFTLYNTRQNPLLFIVHGWRGEMSCSIRCSDKTCQVDFPKDFGCLRPVGYANGFILCFKLSEHHKVESFVLWNPSTRKSKEIAYPSSLYYHIRNIQVVLLDTAVGGSNDYKLVVIPVDHASWHIQYGDFARVPSPVLIEVYSFNSGSWRSYSIDSKCTRSLKNYTSVIALNGAVHWMGHNPMNKPCIVVFDVQNDALHYFSLPVAIQDIESVKFHTLHESLVMMKREDWGYHIWIMERYGVDESWAMERYGVDQFWADRVQIDTIYKALFVHIRRNGCFFTSGRPMEVFDVGGTKIKNLGKNDRGIIGLMDTFVETLALLPGGYKQS